MSLSSHTASLRRRRVTLDDDNEEMVDFPMQKVGVVNLHDD